MSATCDEDRKNWEEEKELLGNEIALVKQDNESLQLELEAIKKEVCIPCFEFSGCRDGKNIFRFIAS